MAENKLDSKKKPKLLHWIAVELRHDPRKMVSKVRSRAIQEWDITLSRENISRYHRLYADLINRIQKQMDYERDRKRSKRSKHHALQPDPAA
jgi:hypothetical protein